MTLPAALRRLLALTQKEFHQLLRDKSNMTMAIGLPIILILIFGYGMSMDVKNAPLGVLIEDESPIIAELVQRLNGSPHFSPIRLHSLAQAEQAMQRHQIDGFLHIPSQTAAAMQAGRGQIFLAVHGSDASRAAIIQSYMAMLLQQWQQFSAARSGHPVGARLNVEQRMWFNAANTSTWYLVPGLIVLIMTLVGAFLTAMVMAREWERGTLEALFVTPVRPVEILLSKIIPYFCVGLLGLGLCLLAARFLFHLPMYGSFILLVASAMLYLLVALGMGLLISSITRNQFLASQLALLISFMPATMLSGFMFDLRNVPSAVYWISQALPATYFMELIKTLFLAGDNSPLLWKNLSILALYATALLGAARLVTRKRLD